MDRSLTSRRTFLRTVAAASCTAGFAQTATKTLVYVGCYTARGQGIYIYEMNPATGALTQVRVVGTPATLPNPSFLALSPNGRYLYSVNEIGNYQSRQSGSVTSFAVDFDNADLTQLNAQPTEGRNPAHLTVDATDRYVIAANYSGATMGTNNVTLLPVNDDGSLAPPAQTVSLPGERGPNTARQEAPHAHMAMADPTGRFILVNDLGLDSTFVFRLDRQESALVSTGNPGVALPGSGPRHMAFHPNGRFLFVINELLNTISVWTWNADTGVIGRQQTISTLPDWYRGIASTAQILVSSDGRFVYGSNRGHDSIAVFRCDPATGQLTFVSEHWTFGETPRNFNIDPSGNFMYVAHQNTDNIAAFRIDRTTVRLEFTGLQLLSPGQPVCIVFQTTPAPGSASRPGVSFVANASGRSQVTLAWNAPGTEELDLRIGAPNGVSMGRQASYGVTTTGDWIAEGMMFYLLTRCFFGQAAHCGEYARDDSYFGASLVGRVIVQHAPALFA